MKWRTKVYFDLCLCREKNLSFCHIKLLIIETTNISILFFSQQSLNSLLKGWIHHSNNYAVIIANRLTATKHPCHSWQYIFYVFMYILSFLLTQRAFYKVKEMLTFRKHLVSVFSEVCVLCCVFLFSVCSSCLCLRVFQIWLPNINYIFNTSNTPGVISWAGTACLFLQYEFSIGI